MSPTIRNQATLTGIALALALGLALTAFGTGTALAVSPSETECQGEFTRIQGTVTCLEEEQVANENASDNNNSQSVTKEESAKGNITPKEGELNCDGPPGKQDPGCP